LAHMFLELLCVCLDLLSMYATVLSRPPAAAEMNKSIDVKELRIYGLLTDLVRFAFYSYDPTNNRFCYDETIFVNNKRIDASSDMMDGPYFSPMPLCLEKLTFSLKSPIRSSALFCQHI